MIDSIDEQFLKRIVLTRITKDPTLPHDYYNPETQQWETISMYRIGYNFFVTSEIYDKIKEAM